MRALVFFVVFPAVLIFAAVNVSQIAPGEIVIHWQNDGNWQIMPSDLGDFSEIILPDAHYIWDVGKPHLPVFRIPLRVGENIGIEAQAMGWIKFEMHKPILPSQPMKMQRWNAVTSLDTMLYSSYLPFPIDMARIVQNGVIHGDRFAIVEICPFRYLPDKMILQIADEITVSVDFDTPNNEAPSKIFDVIKRNFFVNAEDKIKTHAPAKMLVICPTYYRLQIEPWLQWRRQAGYEIITRTPDELGGTTESIADSIAEIYLAHSGIDYLVIVGDVHDVPTFSTGGSSSPTDIDYGCVDGEDYVPDMLIGRISVEDMAQLDELAIRFLEYELFAYSDTNFAQRFLFGTSNDEYFHDMVHIVHNYVRDSYLSLFSIGYEELDGYIASEADVIAAIDSGYAYYYYYGHGWSGGLSAPPLTIDGVGYMSNNQKYPFIVGNACSTNDFTLPTSFGEALLRRNNAGAIAYIGGSNSTYWYPDSVWEIETFRAFLQDSMASAMGQCYAAFLEVMVSFPDYGHYFFDVYNLVGDPSIKLWSGIQGVLEIAAPATYTFGCPGNIDVEIRVDGEPMANATVCLSWSDSAIVVITDDSGWVEFDIPTLPPETLLVSTTAFRCIPTQTAVMPMAPDEPFIALDNFLPDDAESISVRNDGDGRWDFAETIAVKIEITNYGTNAHDVEMQISCDEPYITIWNNSIDFPIADSGMSLEHLFYIEVSPMISNGLSATFAIEISDSEEHIWEYEENLVFNAPVVEFESIEIDDATFGDGDFIIEEGETVLVMLKTNIPTGCNIQNLDISCIMPDEVDFVEFMYGDTTIEDITPPWSQVLPFALEITDEPDFNFPMVFEWNVIERGDVDTVSIFIGSMGYSCSMDSMSGWLSAADGSWSSIDWEYNSPPACFVNRGEERFYFNDEQWALLSPMFIVPWNAIATFWYMLYIPTSYSDDDIAWVELWTEEDTTILLEFDNPVPYWDFAYSYIPAQHFGSAARIAFRFQADASNSRTGFYVDDISVVSAGSFLGDAAVTPSVDENDAPYSFGITYAAPDGEMPTAVKAFVDDVELPMLPDIYYETEWIRYSASSILDVGIHRYYFVVEDEFGTHRFPPEGELSGPMVGEMIFQSDFESDNGGFSTESTGWYWSEVDSTHSGTMCWNNIGTSVEYESDLNARLVWQLDLRELEHPVVSFWNRMEFAMGSSSGLIRDGGNVKIRSGMTEEIIDIVPQYDGAIISDSNPLAGEPAYGEFWRREWKMFSIDLQDWAGEEVDIVFNIGTNDIESAQGWFIDDARLIDVGVVGIETGIAKPGNISLSMTPNPFNSSCRISLAAFASGDIDIDILDISGRSVANLKISSGEHSVMWKPESKVSSGIYICRIKNTDSTRISQKLVLMR